MCWLRGKHRFAGTRIQPNPLLTTVTLALHCSKMGTSSRQQFLWPIRYDDIFCAAVESFVSSKEFVRKFLGHVFWDGWFGMSLQTKPIYDFGPFRLNTAEHLLLRDGEPVRLPPKAFELLLVLVQNQGRLLEKDELLSMVWPDAFVEEANLSYNISLIRKALGRKGSGSSSIETIPKLGYRFLAQVTEVKEDDRILATKESLTHHPIPMNTARAPDLVRFGEFEADLRIGELRKQDLKIRLPAELFQVLAICLLECPREFVTSEEIQNRLWPDDSDVKFEPSIEAVIGQLQLALGDSTGNPRFVEILAGRGYRFIAPVEGISRGLAPGQPQAPAPGAKRSYLKWLLPISTLFLIALTGPVIIRSLLFEPLRF